MEFAFEVSV